MEQVLGDGHPDTLTTRNLIACMTGLAGNRQGALKLFQGLLPDLQRVLGDDHPDTLTTRNHITYWTGQLGDGDPSEPRNPVRAWLSRRRRRGAWGRGSGA